MRILDPAVGHGRATATAAPDLPDSAALPAARAAARSAPRARHGHGAPGGGGSRRWQCLGAGHAPNGNSPMSHDVK